MPVIHQFILRLVHCVTLPAFKLMVSRNTVEIGAMSVIVVTVCHNTGFQ